MNNIIRNNPTPKTLEETVDDLCKYGKPRFQFMGDGWYCVIEMYVQGKGIQFNVASDFKHASMLEASTVCYERLHKALRDLGL